MKLSLSSICTLSDFIHGIPTASQLEWFGWGSSYMVTFALLLHTQAHTYTHVHSHIHMCMPSCYASSAVYLKSDTMIWATPDHTRAKVGLAHSFVV